MESKSYIRRTRCGTRQLPASLVLLWLALAGLGAVARAAPSASGVTGRVMQAPAAPGPQRIGEEPGMAPVSSIDIQLRNKRRAVVATATTTADGAFTLRAPAGRYTLHVDTQAMYPRCEPVPVKVGRARMVRVDVHCDSGMR